MPSKSRYIFWNILDLYYPEKVEINSSHLTKPAARQMTIELEDGIYVALLKLVNVTVEEAGKYKVTAKNDLGESNANITLNFDSKLVEVVAASSLYFNDVYFILRIKKIYIKIYCI